MKTPDKISRQIDLRQVRGQAIPGSRTMRSKMDKARDPKNTTRKPVSRDEYYESEEEDGWFGIKNAKFVYHGNWNDPEIIYDGVSINYYDVERWLLDVYREENPGDRNDKGFGKWLALPSTKPEIQSCLDCIVQAMAENGELDDNDDEDGDLEAYDESEIDDDLRLDEVQSPDELITSILEQLHFVGSSNFDYSDRPGVFYISNGNGRWRIEVKPEDEDI